MGLPCLQNACAGWVLDGRGKVRPAAEPFLAAPIVDAVAPGVNAAHRAKPPAHRPGV